MILLEALNSVVTRLLPPAPGQDAQHPLALEAVPGLVTVLDAALYRAVEGQLTATTCAGHALLSAWLDLKHQARLVLRELAQSEESPRRTMAESFCRLAIEACQDATERLSTDKLAQSANLSDPYTTTIAGGSNTVLSGVGVHGIRSGVLDSQKETGRRFISEQRPKDCWETSRLICPDYVWADDSYTSCQRLMRHLTRHAFYNDNNNHHDVAQQLLYGTPKQRVRLSALAEQYVAILLRVVQDSLPCRMAQFKAAAEADSVVSKRLYLVKCEYRAPFRTFLEAHQSVQRAPSIQAVGDYLASTQPAPIKQQRQKQAQATLQALLETPQLLEALACERDAEGMEVEVAKALFPFTEMARILEHKRGRLVALPGVVSEEKVSELQGLLRRLKVLLCRRSGQETSTGIRPLLLDIRGMPRDEDVYHISASTSTSSLTSVSNNKTTDMDVDSLHRLDQLVDNLRLLGSLMKNHKNAFPTDSKRSDVDFPASILKGCTEEFDGELFHCQVHDFFTIVKEQRHAMESGDVERLEAEIRKAEMEASLAVASNQNLEMVRQRLELLGSDGQKRFDVLKQMVEEVCLREMNLHVSLTAPDPCKTLLLKPTSALGLFGYHLQRNGEPLPIG
ncbi:expressed unknown protein [Seminavis robusta]|uniref:Uncharacterized protein n=1 Tax=Seminavis robusta TaxID=568900 RepID=A0A9N8HWQ8_9STRA|nr:expressed unknown protein [Seminavis robusta]|eukprot:Sro2754_g336270.1 n/a (622) ;mRNA; f:5074-7031